MKKIFRWLYSEDGFFIMEHTTVGGDVYQVCLSYKVFGLPAYKVCGVFFTKEEANRARGLYSKYY